MFIAGASQTMMPIVGTLYGEKDMTGIRFTVRRALVVVMSACVALVVFFELFPETILLLFGVNAPDEIALGTQAIRIFAISLIGTGFSFLMMYYFQTIQRRGISSAISVVQGVAVTVPAAFLLSAVWGSVGIWVSFSLAEICTFVMILLVTAAISRRSGGRLTGIFLFEDGGGKQPLLDVTIENKKQQAVGLSEKVIGFCRENGVEESVATYVGMAVEEMGREYGGIWL